MGEVESKARSERLRKTRLSPNLRTRQHGTELGRAQTGELGEFMGNYYYFLCEVRSHDAC